MSALSRGGRTPRARRGARRTPRGRLLAAGLALLLAACGGDDGGGSATSSTSTSSTTTTPPGGPGPAPSPPAGAGDLSAVRFALTRVADLEQPVAMAVRAGYPRPYVAEKTGRVRVLDGESAPVVDLRGEVSDGGEQGLLGIAFSPDGRFLYTSYTNRAGDSRLDEWAMGDGPRSVDVSSRRQVLAIDQPAANHNGGTVVFGPDGLLWYGLGDGGGAGDRFGNAQDPGTLLGSVLRIDPRPSGSSPYSSPAGNPHLAGGGRPEIALIGVRNPWKFSFDRATGDLWIGDVGQNAREEIDRLPAGSILGTNLGWPFLEGTRPYSGRPPPDGLTGPVHEYGRDAGRSVVGGFVYRGAAIPSMAGAYLYADTYDPTIRLLAVRSGGVDGRDSGIDVPGGSVVGFGEDAAGELYVLSLSGGVFRLDPA